MTVVHLKLIFNRFITVSRVMFSYRCIHPSVSLLYLVVGPAWWPKARDFECEQFSLAGRNAANNAEVIFHLIYVNMAILSPK